MDILTHLNITDILEIIRKVDPVKILDVSVGFGRWGILCRELLESDKIERKKTDQWNIKIDGIEPLENNKLHKYHDIFYDNIYRQNIADFLKDHVELYDLTIMTEVLEFNNKSISYFMIENVMEISRFVLIYVPLFKESGDKNKIFRSSWNEEDFSRFDVVNKIIINDMFGNRYGIFLIECNCIKRIFNKKVVVYGTGDYFNYSVKPFINMDNVICFMEDNLFKQGLFFMNKRIQSVKGVKKIQDDFIIIIASLFYREIKRKLEAACLYNCI